MVTIDGKTVSTAGSNRVEATLSVGRHRLVLAEGTRKQARSFEVETGQTTNLATITLAP